jgi:hypothetical protein
METTSIDDIKKDIETGLREDPVFIGMSSNSLRNLGIAIAIQIGAEYALKKGAKKTGKFLVKKGFTKTVTSLTKVFGKKILYKTVASTAVKGMTYPIKVAARSLAKLVAKIGERAALKAGVGIGKSAAAAAYKKIAKQFAAEFAQKLAATTAGKLATKASASAAKAAAKAGMGPIGWAMLAFDAITMTVDIADAGGYGLLDKVRSMRDQISKELKAQFAANGETYPYNVGPLDKYLEQARNDYQNEKYFEQIEIVKSNPKYEALVKDELAETYIDPEVKWDDIIQKLTDADKLALEGEATKRMCVRLEGTMEEELCIYDDYYEKAKQAQIDKALELTGRYVKPLMDAYEKWRAANPDATFEQSLAEYGRLFDAMIDYPKIEIDAVNLWCVEEGGKILPNGLCTYKTRESCDKHYTMEDDAPVNTYTQWDQAAQKCNAGNYTNKKLCDENKLIYNSNTGLCEITEQYCLTKGADWNAAKKDCIIPAGQNILELIFGTALVRLFKQGLDPAQYEPCPPGLEDVGYGCARTSVQPSPCSNYGDRWYNEGVRCANLTKYIAADCPPGYWNTGATCEPQSFGRGSGVAPNVVSEWGCPASAPYKRGADSKAGWCDNGSPWVWKLKTTSRYEYIKSGVPYSKSPGVSDYVKNAPNTGWEQNGSLYYPKCPAGTSAVGCCVCRTNGSTSFGYEKMTCPTGFHRVLGSCYQNANKTEQVTTKNYSCAPGYSPYLGMCRSSCPPGFKNDGLICWKPRRIEISSKKN